MKIKVEIEGMTCEHCVNHVKEALTLLDGVTNVKVNLPDNIAVIDSDIILNEEDIKFAIDDAGYEVIGIEEL